MKISFLVKFTLALVLTMGSVGAASSQENSLLWKISGNGLEKPSYLFGTIHLICKEDFLIDERVKLAFERSEKLVMELDLSDPQLQTKMQQVSMNPGMKNIQSELDPADAEIVDKFLTENYGAGLAQLGILKPFVLSSMALIKAIPCEQLESYEQYFVTLATASKTPILGLETPEFQVGIFDQIPPDVQLQELVKMLKEESAEEDFRQMVDAYLAEDLAGLYELMNSEGLMLDFRSLILDQRNEAWIGTLAKEMQENSLFVAVGAGHLGGEKGVISLLKNAGYQVEAVEKPIPSN